MNKNLLNSFLDLECPWHEKHLKIDDEDSQVLKCKYCEELGWHLPWTPDRVRDEILTRVNDKDFLYRLTKIREYYDQQKPTC